MNKKIIVILGLTASGKTKLAVALAKKFKGEIISADSRQVYKGMDIGTGKDLKEYGRIPYHLIDIKKPSQQFTVSDFQKEAKIAIEKILAKHKLPIIVGGTGLYLQALIENYSLPQTKPDLALRKKLEKKSLTQLQTLIKKYKIKLNESDFKNKRRLIRKLETRNNQSRVTNHESPYKFLVLGLTYPRPTLYQKIDARLKNRLQHGLIEEVKKLRKNGLSWKRLQEFGLEYYWVSRFLQKKITRSELLEKLRQAIHHFAKRQVTWFKRMKYIKWLKKPGDAQQKTKKFLS